jgi:hypothetical protein
MSDRYEHELAGARPPVEPETSGFAAPSGYAAPPRYAEVVGHAAVDAALAELARCTGLPPAEQVAAYEVAHRSLLATLATIDQS